MNEFVKCSFTVSCSVFGVICYYRTVVNIKTQETSKHFVNRALKDSLLFHGVYGKDGFYGLLRS